MTYSKTWCENRFNKPYAHTPIDRVWSELSYRDAHRRTELTRGKPYCYACPCGSKQAQQWGLVYRSESWRHGVAASNGTTADYSLDPFDYVAMCRKCHERFDHFGILPNFEYATELAMTCDFCNEPCTPVLASRLDSRLQGMGHPKCCVYAWGEFMRSGKKVVVSVHRSAGTANPRAKFNEDDICAIREGHRLGMTQTQLAKQYGCSVSGINKIVTGRNWGHL